MTQESRPTVADHPFDLASALRRDEACVQFEDDLEAGLAPEIGQFLGRLPVPERPELFLELLGLELAYRRRNGEHPNPGEYQARFAEFGSQIDAVFGGPRFSILGFHAAGGMGEVYRAYDQELHRVVALKQIQERYARDRHIRNRFIREAEITAQLQHPGIVPIYDRGHRKEDGRPYYVMRFVEGDDLPDAIAAHHLDHPHPDTGTLEFRVQLQRFIDICNAIAFAHSRGVLHRDLKPHNIRLGNFGEALIIDWGLARAVAASSEAVDSADVAGAVSAAADDLDEPNMRYASCTPAYMSPEQAWGDRKAIGMATDVYGLGTVLYQLLTGAAPVTGTSETEIRERVLTGAVTPPRTLNLRVPRSLEAVCLKALAPKPEDRYPTAKALRDDILNWLADRPVSIYRDPWTTRLLRWARKHRATAMTAAGILITALVATVVVAAGKTEDNRRLRLAYLNLKTATDKLAAGLKREQRLRKDVESVFVLAMKATGPISTLAMLSGELKDPDLREIRDRRVLEAIDFHTQLSRMLKEMLVDETPDSPRYRFYLAKTYRATGDLLRGPDIRYGLDKWKASERTSAQIHDALMNYASAQDILDLLARQHPSDPSYTSELGAALNNRAIVLCFDFGKHEEALSIYEDAVDKQLAAYRMAPKESTFRMFLRNHLIGMAREYRDLGRLSEALATSRRTLELWPDDPIMIYNVAAEMATCVSIAAQNRSKPGVEAQADAKRFGDLAMETLKQAVAKGFDHAESMKAYYMLDPIRDRDDYRALEKQLMRQREAASTSFVPSYEDKDAYEILSRPLSNPTQIDREIADRNEKIKRLYNARGGLRRLRGDYNDAVADHTLAIEFDAGDPWSYFFRGLAFRALGKDDRAITDFSRALDTKPGFHTARAASYNRASAFDRARADFDQLIELEPHNPEYRWLRGEVRAKMHDVDGALTDESKAVELAPDNPTYRVHRALAYAAKGDRERAMADFNQAISLDSKNPQAYLNRGRLRNSLADYRGALADYETAIHNDPDEAVTHNSRAWLLATCPVPAHRDGNQAIASATRACEITNWKNASYLDTLAASYAEAGDFEAAVRWQRQAVDLLPRESDERAGMEERIKLYQNRTAYHEPSHAAGDAP